jgi:hypothetical protein
MNWTRSMKPNNVVELLTLLPCTQEVSGSNLNPETGYLTEVYCDFPQYLHHNSCREP